MTRPARAAVFIDLPRPPSVNAAFASRHGSARTQKTGAYRFWLQEVRELYGNGEALPVLTPGPYGLWIDLPRGMKGDTDNRTKLLSDIVKRPGPDQRAVGLGVVADDLLMRDHYIRPGAAPPGRCYVTLITLRDWADYVLMRLT